MEKGRTAEERRETGVRERGGRIPANVLKEIAGMSLLEWN